MTGEAEASGVTTGEKRRRVATVARRRWRPHRRREPVSTPGAADSRGRRDAGFATVWVVTAMGVVGVAAAAAVGIGLVTVERHRAGSAADAAALTAALGAVRGATASCVSAADIAERNGARISSCTLDGPVASVEVVVTLPGPLSKLGVATAHARAGPVSDVNAR